MNILIVIGVVGACACVLLILLVAEALLYYHGLGDSRIGVYDPTVETEDYQAQRRRWLRELSKP